MIKIILTIIFWEALRFGYKKFLKEKVDVKVKEIRDRIAHVGNRPDDR